MLSPEAIRAHQLALWKTGKAVQWSRREVFTQPGCTWSGREGASHAPAGAGRLPHHHGAPLHVFSEEGGGKEEGRGKGRRGSTGLHTT